MNYQAESECQFNVLKLFSFCAQTKRCQQETEKQEKWSRERKFQRQSSRHSIRRDRDQQPAVWDKNSNIGGNREVAVDFQEGKVRDKCSSQHDTAVTFEDQNRKWEEKEAKRREVEVDEETEEVTAGPGAECGGWMAGSLITQESGRGIALSHAAQSFISPYNFPNLTVRCYFILPNDHPESTLKDHMILNIC